MRHLRLFIACLALTSVGCRGESPAPPQRPTKAKPPPAATLVFAAMPCDPRVGGDHDPIHELRARATRPAITIEADYLAIKRVTVHGAPTVAERGTPCATATDKPTCVAALAELERAQAPKAQACNVPGDGDCPERMYVLTTRGDTKELWSTPEQLRRLLGPIDTPDDAWLLAQAVAHEHLYLCGDRDFSAFRADERGFELRARRYTSRCPVEITEYRYRVDRDGTVRRLGSAVVHTDPNCSSSY